MHKIILKEKKAKFRTNQVDRYKNKNYYINKTLQRYHVVNLLFNLNNNYKENFSVKKVAELKLLIITIIRKINATSFITLPNHGHPCSAQLQNYYMLLLFHWEYKQFQTHSKFFTICHYFQIGYFNISSTRSKNSTLLPSHYNFSYKSWTTLNLVTITFQTDNYMHVLLQWSNM